MPVSRLRLRVAAGFAIAFAVGLALLAAAALGYLWRESHRRLDAQLNAVTRDVATAIVRELKETPDSTLAYVAGEVVNEWPEGRDGFVVMDGAGVLAAAADVDSMAARILAAWIPSRPTHFEVDAARDGYRAIVLPATATGAARRVQRFAVIAYGTTRGIHNDTSLLATTLAIATPLIVLLSLGLGYALSKRALEPVDALGKAVAAIDPTDLSDRLPVPDARDEVATLAQEFNALLTRLDASQRRNRGFVREAAHQIRTPLTLVLGEAGHDLSVSDATPERLRATLGRIRTAAEQMRRRVDELFLLAEAEAGERIRLEQLVELDGLVLECTDLMRGRAAALGRSLALGVVEPVTVHGNEGLLREALVELLENSCRHGGAGRPVTTEVRRLNGDAVLTVESADGSASSSEADGRGAGTGTGLGVPIVTWIAEGHGGRFERDVRDGVHVARLVLPATDESA
jgi:signal transduction histidine kinase